MALYALYALVWRLSILLYESLTCNFYIEIRWGPSALDFGLFFIAEKSSEG